MYMYIIKCISTLQSKHCIYIRSMQVHVRMLMCVCVFNAAIHHRLYVCICIRMHACYMHVACEVCRCVQVQRIRTLIFHS